MITAVDTNVLIDVFSNDARHGAASAEALRLCLREGSLVVCDVVWAEVRGVFPLEPVFDQAMTALGVRFSPILQRAAAGAGVAWKAYRAAGGTRTRVIADFLIGAHAAAQADRLLTRDRGYYRAHFQDLAILSPAGA